MGCNKLLAHFFLVFGSTSIALGQVADFPTISGQNLVDQEVTLPTSNDKVTLIALAYSKKSDEYLKDWLQPVYQNFINPPKSSFIPMEPYDVNIYFVALLKGIAKTAKGKVESGLNKNLDPEYHPYTLISTDDFKPLKDALKFGRKDYPYFFVVDKAGKIVYRTEGIYTTAKMQEIVNKVDEHSMK
ncbi:MAG: hypothetical protein RJQ09_18770 [Cyclobacteriaceae bacterium]